MIKSISNKLLQYLKKMDVIDKSEDALAYYRYGLEITISGIVKKCAVREYPKSWIGRYQAA